MVRRDQRILYRRTGKKINHCRHQGSLEMCNMSTTEWKGWVNIDEIKASRTIDKLTKRSNTVIATIETLTVQLCQSTAELQALTSELKKAEDEYEEMYN